MSGRIKIHRKITEREWYQDPNIFRLFFHCLVSANHTDKKRQGIDIKRGSFITSYENLSKLSKLSVQQVRTALEKLALTGEINKQTTSKYTMITVVKYCDYNDKDDTDNKQTTNKQQTNNKQITTTKEGKESKEGKEDNTLTKFVGDRNSISELKQNGKKVKGLPKTIKITEALKTIRKKTIKEYTEEELKEATNKYIEAIEKTKPNSQRSGEHRFTLFEFLKQSNGLQKYINL